MFRTFLSLVVALATLGAPLPTTAQNSVPQDIHLTVLHTNDTHGHLRPYSYPETFDPKSDIAKLKVRRDIGGAARRATLIKRIRQEKGHATLVIDAGDICDGTPFSTEYHGDADIAAMNAIGYDLACPGNHEYSNPLPQVKKMIADAHFPLISANSTVIADGTSVYTPSLIREIGGVRIAFLGLLTYDARTYTAAKNDLKMEPPIAVAKRLVPELRQKADLVVAVTHIGVDEDRKMAAEVPGIDLIVGGHSHTLLEKPVVVPSADGKTRTLIVQDFQWAGTLGRLDLTLHHDENGTWRIAQYKGQLLPITSETPEDAEVASVVDRYWNPIKGKYGEVIGVAADDFTKRGPDQAEYNLMADAVRAQTQAEFSIENMGGVRAPITKGAITYGDLVTVDPFNNTIITFHATGRQIKAILARHRPAVSGIRYVYDHGELQEATIQGKLIEDNHTYFGVTNSYFANFILKDIPDKTDTKKGRLDALVAYIRAQKTIKPAYDSRRLLKGIGDFD